MAFVKDRILYHKKGKVPTRIVINNTILPACCQTVARVSKSIEKILQIYEIFLQKVIMINITDLDMSPSPMQHSCCTSIRDPHALWHLFFRDRD